MAGGLYSFALGEEGPGNHRNRHNGHSNPRSLVEDVLGFGFVFSIPFDPPSRVDGSQNYLVEGGDVAADVDVVEGGGEPEGALIEHLD